MELPSIFEKDIQLKTLNIITRVVIGEEDPIYLSTHSLNFDGQYYKPLLLGIPSMKESVDYESRNFKISNVTLNISNYKIKGERFSDTFKNNPLINKIVEVFGIRNLQRLLKILYWCSRGMLEEYLIPIVLLISS